MKYTIFSIDHAHDLHTMAKFLRLMDTHEVMQRAKGNCKLMIGSYRGKLEYSFITLTEDFETFIKESGYVDGQESMLQMSECN